MTRRDAMKTMGAAVLLPALKVPAATTLAPVPTWHVDKGLNGFVGHPTGPKIRNLVVTAATEAANDPINDPWHYSSQGKTLIVRGPDQDNPSLFRHLFTLLDTEQVTSTAVQRVAAIPCNYAAILLEPQAVWMWRRRWSGRSVPMSPLVPNLWVTELDPSAGVRFFSGNLGSFLRAVRSCPGVFTEGKTSFTSINCNALYRIDANNPADVQQTDILTGKSEAIHYRWTQHDS